MTKTKPPAVESHPYQPPSLIEAVIAAVKDPNVDVSKMRELVELKREMDADEARLRFSNAMLQLQKEIEPVKKDAENTQTSSKYATYSALDAALRPFYTKHGFEVSYDTEASSKGESWLRVVCIVNGHDHERRHGVDIAIDAAGPQGKKMMTMTHASASGISYGRRYSLGNAFNITFADDDGNRAGAKSLTENQIDEITMLAKTHNVDLKDFCEHYDIDTIAEIPRRQFAAAKTAIIARSKNKGGGDAPAPQGG